MALTEIRPGRWILVAICLGILSSNPTFARALPQAAQSSSGSSEQNSLGLGDSIEEARQKSVGCVSCHNPMDSVTMHTTGTVRLGCTDCHGGNAQIASPPGVAQTAPQYRELTKQAHPRPRFPESARSSANPVRSYANWLKEDPNYIKFFNL